MKKIFSIILSLVLILSVFNGVFVISAETTEYTALTGREDFYKGVNIHPSWYASYSDTYQVLKDAKELGSNIVRINAQYTTENELRYLDAVIKIADSLDMEIMLVCDDFYTSYLSVVENDERVRLEALADGTVAAITTRYANLAKRFKGKIAYYQIGNELDNYYYVGNYTGGHEYIVSSQDYTGVGDNGVVGSCNYHNLTPVAEALSAAYSAIKTNDADAKTVLNYNWLHYGFLEGLKTVDPTLAWDVTGMDWYSDNDSQAYENPDDQKWLNLGLNNYQSILSNIKDFAPEVIVTEAGITNIDADGDGEGLEPEYLGTPEWLAGFLQYAYSQNGETDEANVIGFIAYELYDEPEYITDRDNVYNSEAYLGLIDKDGNKKDAYYVLQDLYGGEATIAPDTIAPMLNNKDELVANISGSNTIYNFDSVLSTSTLLANTIDATDITGADYIEADFYVEDADMLYEFFHSLRGYPAYTTPDNLEFALNVGDKTIAWNLASDNVVLNDGWNHLVFVLRNAHLKGKQNCINDLSVYDFDNVTGYSIDINLATASTKVAIAGMNIGIANVCATSGEAGDSVMEAGVADIINYTPWTENSQSTIPNGAEISDYAKAVGDRVSIIPTGIGWHFQHWSGRNAGYFTVGDITHDFVYSINARTIGNGDNGIIYNVAAGNKIIIPIDVPTAAKDILNEFTYFISTNDGATWKAVTPDLVSSTTHGGVYYPSTRNTYSISTLNDCQIKILFPKVFKGDIKENEHIPNGDGDSNYDALVSLNVGNLYNGVMYMLPATCQSLGLNMLGQGDTDTILAEQYGANMCSATDAYRFGTTSGSSSYGAITGYVLAVTTAKRATAGYLWQYYGTEYPSADETVFALYNNTTIDVPSIEYWVKGNTVLEFDIGLHSSLNSHYDSFQFSYSTDYGTTYTAIDPTKISYSESGKTNGRIRTYNIWIEEGCRFKITFPSVAAMLTSLSEVNLPAGRLYQGALFVSPLRTQGVIEAGVRDEVATTLVESYYAQPSYNTTTGISDICSTLVQANWKFNGLSAVFGESLFDKYVYTITTQYDTNKNSIPYIDFAVKKGDQIQIPVGMYSSFWTEFGDMKLYSASTNRSFKEISADDVEIEIMPETTMAYNGLAGGAYDGTRVKHTFRIYKVAVEKDGYIRIAYPDTIKNLCDYALANFNTEKNTFLKTSAAAIIVAPKGESIEYGDLNGDDKINILDLVRFKRYLADNEGVTIPKLSANVDGVSGLNAGDLAVYIRYVLGENIKFGY